MSASPASLNLARKWRSQSFDQIVGQDLAVRLLKNSLYKNYFFPVYLFSGQRGCGKTTTARVFAAAVNCQTLESFQEDPTHHVVPCGTCSSCMMMRAGSHPDFIEMDAASHTGVDNVRGIVDSASLLPVEGLKKVYLIDEAHMLSKAAFNAFLKILEEPPSSVIFILATTDPEKIIETVRSRCFRLLFTPIVSDVLVSHLDNVCKTEGISADREALALIARATDGSARDALNVLEQVRFAVSSVTCESVYQVLGYLDQERLYKIVELVLQGAPQELIQFIAQEQLETVNVHTMWHHVVDVLKAVLWSKYGASSAIREYDHGRLAQMGQHTSTQFLSHALSYLWDQEPLFLKTSAQYAFFQISLITLAQQHQAGGTLDTSSKAPSLPQAASSAQKKTPIVVKHVPQPEVAPVSSASGTQHAPEWNTFVTAIGQLNDPLLDSVFSQAERVVFVQEKGIVQVTFPKQLSFFSDWLEDNHDQWRPLMIKAYNAQVSLEALFAVEKEPQFEKKIAPARLTETVQTANQQGGQSVIRTPVRTGSARSAAQSVNTIRERPIDVSDREKWKTVHLIKHYFSGTVTEVQGDV